MENINGYIYVITNMVNVKKYIGQTTIGFKKRYNNDLYKNTSNIHLKNAIFKYGIGNFEIIEEFDSANSIEKLNELEKYWIQYFGGINSGKLYNFSSGGLNCVYSDNHKAILSKKATGRKFSEETKIKMSISQKEKNSKMTAEERSNAYGHNKGKEISKEVRKKIIEAKLNAKNKDEIVKKISEKIKKKVICLNTGVIFDSLKESGEYYGFSSCMISTCCKGKREYAGRDENGNFLKWEYYVECVEEVD